MSLREATETRRVERSGKLGKDRASLGQFFTPSETAVLVASMLDLPPSSTIRILDPGAGIGSLSAALVERISAERPDLKVRLTAVDLDTRLLGDLQATLSDCAEAMPGEYTAVLSDFTTFAAGALARGEQFDVVIMNPPYKKILSSSDIAKAFVAAGVQTTNLYTGFMTLGLRLLAPHGQMVAITPRSFANGTYFKRFREELLTKASIKRIHVFEHRNAVFKDSEVLQENIIFTVEEGAEQGTVAITASDGRGSDVIAHEVPYSAVVEPDDPHMFVRITTDSEGLEVSSRMAEQPSTLADLGIRVSTGRVVDFRSRDWLRKEYDAATDVPLIYPGHLEGGRCKWPEGAVRKYAGFDLNGETEPMLLPAGHYVLVNRFSAKEEPRRVVASLVAPDDLPGNRWAFENHLNVFHDGNQGLDPDLARELTDYLNSSLVDAYVRLFSGHTQINAADLRSLRYPALLGSRRPVLI